MTNEQEKRALEIVEFFKLLHEGMMVDMDLSEEDANIYKEYKARFLV